jgi:hypothetical protein
VADFTRPPDDPTRLSPTIAYQLRAAAEAARLLEIAQQPIRSYRRSLDPYGQFLALPEKEQARIWEQFLARFGERVPPHARALRAGKLWPKFVIAAQTLDRGLKRALSDPGDQHYLGAIVFVARHAGQREDWATALLPLLPEVARKEALRAREQQRQRTEDGKKQCPLDCEHRPVLSEFLHQRENDDSPPLRDFKSFAGWKNDTSYQRWVKKHGLGKDWRVLCNRWQEFGCVGIGLLPACSACTEVGRG